MFLRFSVRLGEHTISTPEDCDNPDNPCWVDTPPFQDIEVEKSIIHEDYSNSEKINDIALVRLKQNAIFKNIRNVETICLPIYDFQHIDNILATENKTLQTTIAGWGFTEHDNNNKRSDHLVKAYVPYISHEDCVLKFNRIRQQLPALTLIIRDTHLVKRIFTKNICLNSSNIFIFKCAGGVEGVDTCKGDSGGPLIYHASNLKGLPRMFQHGIVSVGIDCSLRGSFPGVYTRITPFMKWILDNLTNWNVQENE